MLSNPDLVYMRSVQTGSMGDTCYLQVYSRTFDAAGQAVETWTESATTTACGLDMRPGKESSNRDQSYTEYDAVIRLPITAAPDVKDRIRVTKRFGESITALTFEISAPIQRGPSGIRLILKRIEP